MGQSPLHYTTSYAYDAAHRLISITYPDGRQVSYTRDAIGRITGINHTVNGTTTSILSQIAYRADGLVTAQTFGNGLTESRTYDLQGRLTSQALGSLDSRAYTYDTNGNPTAIQGASYTYDVLDRLLQGTSPIESHSYAYDGNYNVLYTSHSQTDTQTRDDGFGYNASGHLATYSQGATPKGQYVYNHARQRTRKYSAAGTTVYHYDQQGNLIAETTAQGSLIKAYVYLNSTPIAQVDSNNAVTYLYTDHLGTPRIGTNQAQAKTWEWGNEPYGQTRPNEDADQDTQLTQVNLRFPGQYYDAESGLHYNWNRYYDPRTGRYITSDPIGLEGGPNTYAYVRNNPAAFTDFAGLFDPGGKPALSPTPIKPRPFPWRPLGGTCLGLIAADGPFPFGDVACGCVVVGALIVAGISSDDAQMVAGGQCDDKPKQCGNDKPDDYCVRNAQRLIAERNFLLDVQALELKNGDSETLIAINNDIIKFNREVEAHNRICRHLPVMKLPTLGMR